MSAKLKHNERCKKCKQHVAEMLSILFGEVRINYNLNLSNRPGDFKNTPSYESLRQIFELLQKHRGYTTFVRANKLPNVDFFVPSPGFIFEFDESQHFTQPRELSLSHYQDHIKVGFDKEKWIRLCRELHKKDNDPPYRDEQRAWYDTLRDFAPSILKLKPTVRVFAQDFVWCLLQPNSQADIQKFQQMIIRKI